MSYRLIQLTIRTGR